MSQVKLISHRGNISGPNLERENTPSYLLEALALGVDVEVDIWAVDNKVYLGHDAPDIHVDLAFIESIKDKAWYHCKNLEALEMLGGLSSAGYQYFWHQTDDYTLTNNGHIWVYPEKPYSPNSIVVDLKPDYSYEQGEVFGVCVDYIYPVDLAQLVIANGSN